MGHQCGIRGECMAGNPQVVRTNRGSGGLEANELLGIVAADPGIGRISDGDLTDQVVQPAQHRRLTGATLGTLEQFRIGNSASCAAPDRRSPSG